MMAAAGRTTVRPKTGQDNFVGIEDFSRRRLQFVQAPPDRVVRQLQDRPRRRQRAVPHELSLAQRDGLARCPVDSHRESGQGDHLRRQRQGQLTLPATGPRFRRPGRLDSRLEGGLGGGAVTGRSGLASHCSLRSAISAARFRAALRLGSRILISSTIRPFTNSNSTSEKRDYEAKHGACGGAWRQTSGGENPHPCRLRRHVILRHVQQGGVGVLTLVPAFFGAGIGEMAGRALTRPRPTPVAPAVRRE